MSRAQLPPRHRFFIWLLPLAWALTSFAAVHRPGDEYGLWGAGALAGIWIVPLLGHAGSVWSLLPLVLAAGMATLAIVGALLDRLRTPRLGWMLAWAAAATAFCGLTIAAYPSYDRAISRNGSLLAYLLFASNMGLYAACGLMLLIMPVWRLLRRRPPGSCAHCGYDLTGNRSGRCPECGCHR